MREDTIAQQTEIPINKVNKEQQITDIYKFIEATGCQGFQNKKTMETVDGGAVCGFPHLCNCEKNVWE